MDGLIGYLLADNTSVHDVAVMNGNEEGFDSSIFPAINSTCKDDTQARKSTHGCRSWHVPEKRSFKGLD